MPTETLADTQPVKLNLTYYGGEDLYSDGDIENEILSFVRL